MIAVVVSLVAVVLLVLVVVALGMRSMNRRESALPAERLREMAEKEALTPTMSSDDFATREPKMNHFTPDLTPFDEPKPPRQPRPPSARGKRGMNEFGQVDDYDDDYWTRLQADEGGFGGPLAAQMGASRPVDQENQENQENQQVDADATTVQAPLPIRPQPSRSTPHPPMPRPARPAPEPAVASASLPSGLDDLIAPVQPNPAPTAASLAEQRTVTFAAPTPGTFGDARPSRASSRRGGNRPSSQPAPQPVQGNGGPSRPDPLNDPLGGSYFRRGAGSRPSGAGSPSAGSGSPGARPGNGGPPASMPPMGPTTSGGFPAASAPDPLTAPYRHPAQPPKSNVADNPWAQATSPTSGGWPAANTADILDDPAPSYSSYQTPVYGAPPAGSYEVSSGWATIEDDAITGPSPAVSASTGPSRTFPPAQDRPAAPQGGTTGGYGYEPQPATPASPASPVAWPEPGAPNGSDGASWPSYGELYGTAPETTPAEGGGAGSRGNHRAAQEPDYPDYYR
ncbi:hypothetical protein OG884_03890 [Streptosporangium sp. NBC_01755]|uniref:hypothetical protein n=1 Tax=unclassified Streptosporangium TaxID=2632669 RepID=UPI002DD9B16F|nr:MULTISPECIES: hypothetical protein [unclassified Streptosporangium]WSA27339.1 hypothetical protein OIE13_05545 [Streptosporangium sp. NBC_01810]WSD01088.1 hypothetical protein OG884_03890 [Streptosporangium sp. NBC_01755]